MAQPIIFFDGMCNLCNGFVDWLMHHDSQQVFKVASLQGATAKQKFPSLSRENISSIILLTSDGTSLTKSSAIIAIAQELSLPWRLLAWGKWLPRPLRDAIYDLVAMNRYRFFGHRSTCRLPTPEEKSRFLD